MPIETIEKALYPANWKELSLRIREEARWTCSRCGRPCRRPEESKADFTARLKQDYPDWLKQLVPNRYGRFKLTTAHLNQDRGDNEQENLAALCSPCHLEHDRGFAQFHSFMKKLRRGQLCIPGLDNLFRL